MARAARGAASVLSAMSDAIAERGVPCPVGSCSEIYREKAFYGGGWRPASPLAAANELGETSVMLLIHPTLELAQVEQAGAVVAQVIASANR